MLLVLPKQGATRRFFYHARTPALIALGLRQKSLVSALFVVVIKELEGMPPKTFYGVCGHGAGFQNLTNSNQATLDLGTGASPNYVCTHQINSYSIGNDLQMLVDTNYESTAHPLLSHLYLTGA